MGTFYSDFVVPYGPMIAIVIASIVMLKLVEPKDREPRDKR